ncbi:RNA-guided endonuclease InsQ/TnpB family protein, partial [Bacillus toyonensis]|uniref:RNA-guided endonuclease InsQ/TnpB family protein n=1 Tax=Bacillus toyonensis TaxID=155322 RepID=UPI0011567798
GLVRFAKSREVKGRIVNATVRRNPSGRYFVSLLVETEVQELPKTQSYIGMDVGLKDFVILSDGTTYKNPKFFRSLEEKLVKAQRVLSRRIKGSTRWNKQRVKVARIHEYMKNTRKDYLDKISTEI